VISDVEQLTELEELVSLIELSPHPTSLDQSEHVADLKKISQ